MLRKTNLFTGGLLALIISACGPDEPMGNGEPTGVQTSYTVFSEEIKIIGTAFLEELDNGSYQVTIELISAFQEDVKVVLTEDNAVDGDQLMATFGDLPAGTAEATFSSPSSSLHSYVEMTGIDAHVGLENTGGTRLGYFDIGSNALVDQSKTYSLFEADQQGVSGFALFQKRKNNETLVILQLENTISGDIHPAHIHNNTVIFKGGIAASLNDLQGDNGRSVTNISQMDNTDPLTYDQLVNFDGYIAVHRAANQFSTFSALGDIGVNAFSGEEVVYESRAKTDDNISGTVTVKKREDGDFALIVELQNTIPTVDHVVHIHENTAAEGGGIIIDLGMIDGDVGMALFDVEKLESGADISYDELLGMDSYLQVHYSQSDLSNFVSQADLGTGALTGEKIEYPILEKEGSGISGTAVFEQRVSNETLVTMTLTGLDTQLNYTTHIHQGSITNSGSPVINLSPVQGANGLSITNVKDKFGNNEPVSYEDLLIFDGHIVIHQPPGATSTYLAWGNIGANGN